MLVFGNNSSNLWIRTALLHPVRINSGLETYADFLHKTAFLWHNASLWREKDGHYQRR
jgi:hypothetical protein